MAIGDLRMAAQPDLAGARMVIGLPGWMDGGDVSTGTIEWLAREFDASLLATLDDDGFYLCSFPGSMEVTAIFRPHTKIEDGLITELAMPSNAFFYSEPHRLILFSGKEPDLYWEAYVDCLLRLAQTYRVEMIYFVGSVAGAVPHTRDPRFYSTVSDASLKPGMRGYGVQFSNYEGPASITTLMMQRAAERRLKMATLVAEIPAYVDGKNPRCIEAMARKIAGILGLQAELAALREVSDQFERKLSEVVSEKPELAELVAKLESDYDNEVIDTQMGDLKTWLNQRGVSLD